MGQERARCAQQRAAGLDRSRRHRRARRGPGAIRWALIQAKDQHLGFTQHAERQVTSSAAGQATREFDDILEALGAWVWMVWRRFSLKHGESSTTAQIASCRARPASVRLG